MVIVVLGKKHSYIGTYYNISYYFYITDDTSHITRRTVARLSKQRFFATIFRMQMYNTYVNTRRRCEKGSTLYVCRKEEA